MFKLTPPYRVKISGNRKRIEIRFFGNILWCLFWLVLWNDAHRSKELPRKKWFPKRTPVPAAYRVPARSDCRRSHFYTDFAVLKLQLKIQQPQYNEVYNGMRFISIDQIAKELVTKKNIGLFEKRHCTMLSRVVALQNTTANNYWPIFPWRHLAFFLTGLN
jgi:hypothetical protein